MTLDNDQPDDATGTMWSSTDVENGGLDEDCNPNRVCRNARAFSFEGFVQAGGDLQAGWRETLAREGKLNTSGKSLRDLVFDPSTSG